MGRSDVGAGWRAHVGRWSFALAWGALLALSVHYFIRLGLIVYVGIDTGELLYLLFASLFSYAAIPLVLTLTAFLLLSAFAARRRRQDRWVYALVFVLVAAGWTERLTSAGGSPPGDGPNAFGFYSPFGAGVSLVVNSGKDHIPASRIVTNVYGYRDEPWQVEGDHAHRVLLVGDSMVWGYGIENADDMLDRQLERTLAASSGESWEVINIALSPCALPYYVRGLVDVGRVAKPRFLVMSYLPGGDTHPLDVPTLKLGRSPAMVRALYDYGVVEDVFDHNRDPSLWNLRWDLLGGRDTRSLRARFEELVAFVEAQDLDLIVWEQFDEKPYPVLAPFHGHPRIHFLDWTSVPEAPEGKEAWMEDERIAYRDDFHTTPFGNQLIARAIAAEILRLSTPPAPPVDSTPPTTVDPPSRVDEGDR